MRQGKQIAWPLVLIAAPAAVAIWSGWVGLGGMCGFGPVNLLPGIGGGFTVNTAITLPVGVEAYAALAIGAWMAHGTPGRARRFARWSALGALAYGMAGQVAYHLLAARGVTMAPWPIVVLVSCMPVIVLGFAAALTHLLRSEDVAGELPLHGVSSRSPATPPAAVPSDAEHAAELALAASAAAGNPLSQRQLMTRFGITRAAERTVRQRVLPDPPAGVPVTPIRIPAGASGQGPIPPHGVLAAHNGHGAAGD